MSEKKAEEVGIFDDKKAIIKKYGVIGLAVVSFPLWQPYLDQYLEKGKEKAVSRAVELQITPLENDLVQLQNNIGILNSTVQNMETIMINCRGGIKVLNADEINKIVRNAATLKAQRIRDDLLYLLETNAVDTPIKISRFRAKVKESMQANRVIYMADIKGLQQRGVGVISDYLSNNFPRTEYLDRIMRVVEEYKDEGIPKYDVARDAYIYMLDIQDSFLVKMHAKMKAAEQ